MKLKVGEPITHSYFGSYKLNYKIEYLSELNDHLEVRELIFANGIIEKCTDINDWTLGKIKMFVENGWFWDIQKEDKKEQTLKRISEYRNKKTSKLRVIQKSSAVICWLSIAGMFSSIIDFICLDFFKALKILTSSVIIYCLFWIINKSVSNIVKKLNNN